MFLLALATAAEQEALLDAVLLLLRTSPHRLWGTNEGAVRAERCELWPEDGSSRSAHGAAGPGGAGGGEARVSFGQVSLSLRTAVVCRGVYADERLSRELWTVHSEAQPQRPMRQPQHLTILSTLPLLLCPCRRPLQRELRCWQSSCCPQS